MTDGHVHIERGPYDYEWIMKFAEMAAERNIDEIHLLEHSHRFLDFSSLYESVSSYDAYQHDWLTKKKTRSLDEYLDFVRKMKKRNFPVRIRWGLEVCYIPGKEALIKKLTSDDAFDFVTGAVHWIGDWGFDHTASSWAGKDIDSVYENYYATMTGLACSGLFDILAHPDSIKCFGHIPSVDMDAIYRKLSESLKKNSITAEISAGLYNNYGHLEIGPNPRLLKTLQEHQINLIAASDAHNPGDTGKNIAACYDLMAGRKARHHGTPVTPRK